MKICFVTNIYPPTYLGGPGEVVFNLQKYFLEKGAEAFVFTCGNNDKNYPNTIRTLGGKRLFVPMSPFYYFKKIHSMHFDIFNFHQESAMGFAPLLSGHPKTKIITTLHTEHAAEARAIHSLKMGGLPVDTPPLDEMVVKYFWAPIKMAGTYLDISISKNIIAVSQKTKENYLRQNLLPPEKISVIYNGVDSGRFNPKISGDKIRDKYRLKDAPVILSVGGGIVLKGLVYALFALSKVIKAVPNVKLMAVGIDAAQKNRMLPVIRSLDLEKNVIFVNKVLNHKMPQYYAASDIVLISSLYENLPVVMLEGMASGKPIAASRVGGIPEIIKNRENGLLFDPADVEQMADALQLLIENPSMRHRLGFSGRKLVEEKFSWQRIGDAYYNEFRKL